MRPLLRALLEAGVEVHHGYSAETADSHPLRKAFAPRPLKELIATMSSFDASLIAYNTDVCKRAERFELTVPDRLISSVAAGVPIAIPATGYAASKSYLRDYPAVFEFKSAADLAAQLADRERVAQARARAWDARVNFVASRHSETLKQFVFRMLR
jgi:hypothetical protein